MQDQKSVDVDVRTRKAGVNDFALFGGKPAFASQLHVGRPNVGDVDGTLNRFKEVLHRRWLSNSGPNVQELEHRLSNMLGVKHVICVSNGTAGLELAIRALGLTGEVIVPSFTFIATAHSVMWSGAKPVFCDIDPDTHNIDPAKVEDLITPETSGILGVHLWGRPCAVEPLREIAERRGLKLLFDAAHAFNCTHGGEWVGGFGDAEVFSFHATKFFNTFEGGAVATNDDEIARKMRLMQNFGFTGYDQVEELGTNAKMNEVSAAMGLSGLEELDKFMHVNRRNFLAYEANLRAPGLKLMRFTPGETYNHQYVVVEVDAEVTGVTRDELISLLHAENVLARRYFYPGCHRMEPYRSMTPDADANLPETNALAGRVLCLPTGASVGPSGIEAICALLDDCIVHADAIRRKGPLANAQRSPKYGATGVASA